MFKIIDSIVSALTVLAATGLAGAYFSSYTDPNSFVYPSMLGLGYPYLLIGNLALLLYWTVRWKKNVWLEILVISAGIPAFKSYYGTARETQHGSDSNLSLLSYNVRYFDIYGWSGHQDTKTRTLDYLNRFKGDLICLQEFSLPGHAGEAQEIANKLNTFPHRYVYRDMAIFSRLPFLRHGHLPLEEKSSANCIFADLAIGKDTVRLYSVHLESYKLGQAERAFIQEISRGKKSRNFSDGIKNIGHRLTEANKKRARQAGKLKHHITRSLYPVIVCGDFNDTPLSYTYRKIRDGLEDSFIQQGRGLGNTYIGEFPSFRIDYILHSPQIETIRYLRENIYFSDHYPIRSDLKVKTSE